MVLVPTLADVPAVAERLRQMLHNDSALAAAVAWKTKGPTADFRALMDLSAQHSSCRLCMHLADQIHALEVAAGLVRGADPAREAAAPMALHQRRSCWYKAPGGGEEELRLLVRERGLFEPVDVPVPVDKGVPLPLDLQQLPRECRPRSAGGAGARCTHGDTPCICKLVMRLILKGG